MKRRPRPDPTTAALWCWGFVVLSFLFLPILVMVGYSFNTGRALSVWAGAGLDAFRSAAANAPLVASVGTSLKAALGASVIAVLVGTVAGILLGRRQGLLSRALVLVILLVLVTPEVVGAVSLLIWFVRIGGPLDDGMVRLWVGHSVVGVAVVALIVRARISQLDPALEEASADLYAGIWSTFRSVTLPLLLPAIVSGGLLAFSTSLDSTVISAFVSVAGTTPFPVYVLSAVRAELRPEVAAMSTVLLLMTLLALALVFAVLRRATGRSADAAKGLTGLG